MRILSPNYSPIEENGLLWGLRRLGHLVHSCNLRAVPPWNRALAWRRAWLEFRPDLVFNFGYWHNRFAVSDLDQPPHSPRVPFVYWACDDPIFFELSSVPMLGKADLILTTVEEYILLYRKYGRQAGLLQHGCNPDLMRRVSPSECHQFVLVANNYADDHLMNYRLRSTTDVLLPLINAGFDLKVWGEWWQPDRGRFKLPSHLYGGSLPYTRLPEVYAGAEIVLGLQCYNLSRTQTSCRIFETLGCGAFYLGPDTRGTRTYFQPGRHLVLTGSACETLALAKYYLEHAGERERIAAAGQMEVYSKHTCLHRARELLAAVEGL